MVLDNNSITKFKRDNIGKDFCEGTFKVFDKKYIFEKNKWCIEASHDGYQRIYGVIHNRKIEYLCNEFILIGTDTLLKKIILRRQILKLDFINAWSKSDKNY